VASGPATKYVGGYESNNALRLGLFLAFVSGGVAFPLPFLNDFYPVLMFLWLYLFVGGMLVPLVTGIYLANVEEENRTKASGLANIMYEALGYSPAPFIYGYVQNATGGKKSRWGLIATLMMNIPPIIFIMIANLYASYREKTAE
jgi:MFS family permease